MDYRKRRFLDGEMENHIYRPQDVERYLEIVRRWPKEEICFAYGERLPTLARHIRMLRTEKIVLIDSIEEARLYAANMLAYYASTAKQQ